MTQEEDNTEDIAHLAENAEQLLAKVALLTGDTGDSLVGIAKYGRRNRRMIWAVAISIALDLFLTLLVSGVLIITRDNSQRVEQVTSRLDYAQTTQRQKALCPLYEIFISSDTPAARDAAPDKPRYDHSFMVIREGYNALKCSEFKGSSPQLGP